MVTGPPCPTCGTALRWHPDHNSWGCDRCQRMIAATPYAPVAAPQQPPYQPVPQQPHAVTPVSSQKPPGSKKGLWIVLAVLVLGGGGAAAFMLTRGGGGSGGAGSRDAIVDQTLSALNAGDGTALYGLAFDESHVDDFIDCDDKKDKRDPDKEKERAERHKKRGIEEATTLAEKSKGRGLALDGVTEKTEKNEKTIKKGDDVKGCKAKVDVASHDLEVAAHDGKGKKLVVRLRTIEIDGRWFLEKEPKIKEAADCASAVGGMVAKMPAAERTGLKFDLAAALITRCTEDAWSADAVTCMGESSGMDDSARCFKMLTEKQQKAVTTDMDAKATAAMKAAQPPPPLTPPADVPPDAAAVASDDPGTPATPTASSDDIPKGCQDYITTMEKLVTCDKLPQGSRDGMKQGLDAMKKAFVQMKGMPDSAKKSMEDACKQGADAMKQMSALGC